MKNIYFSTEQIRLAAFLLLKKVTFVGFNVEHGRCWFVFEDKRYNPNDEKAFADIFPPENGRDIDLVVSSLKELVYSVAETAKKYEH